MRRKREWTVFLIFVVVLTQAPSARASVILNEIFADPPMGLMGDANNDGVRSSTRDEFVELLNYGGAQVDISGWTLADGMSIRHTFPSNTILSPYTFLVVFGGGTPVLPGINWQVASSGSLGLNNGGDTVTLSNAQAQWIDQVIYKSIGDKDQSFTLSPDGSSGGFVLHSTVDQAQGALFSPGTGVTSEISLTPAETVTPEPATVLLLGSGLLWAFAGKRRRDL